MMDKVLKKLRAVTYKKLPEILKCIVVYLPAVMTRQLMRYLKSCCILFFIVFIYRCAHAQSSDIFRNLKTQSGLSHNTVTAIIQDEKGFMWFGTEDGLNRYNGYTVDVFKHDPSDSGTISHSHIRSLFVDRENTLWVATDDGLDYFDKATEKFLHVKKGLSSNIITGIAQDNAHNIWVATVNAGITIFNQTGNTFSYLSEKDGMPSSSINTIASDKNGEIIIGTTKGLVLYNVEQKKINVLTNESGNENSLSDNEVACIFVDAENQLWIGTVNGGLNFYSRKTGRFKHYTTSSANAISQNSVFAICSDLSGTIYAGTLGGGLNRINVLTDQVTVFKNQDDNRNSIAGNTVWSLYGDKTGIIWIGTDQGITNYKQDAVRFSTSDDLLAGTALQGNTNIFTFYEDKDHNIWTSVLGAGIIIQNAETGIKKPLDLPGIPHDVFAIFEDSKSITWIGTFDGLIGYDKSTGKISWYKNNPADSKSLSNNNVRCIAEDAKGNLWIGTYGGGLNKFDRSSNTFTSFMHSSDGRSISNNIISCIYTNRQGQLYIGTYGGGLSVYNADNTFTSYTRNPSDANSISGNFINCIYPDPLGNLWIGTYGGGLNLFNTTSKIFTRYTERDGLPNNTINSIITDKLQRLWISTNQEICKINLTENNKLAVHRYDEQDGISNKFNPSAVLRSQNGMLWFGGANGYVKFNPEKIIDNGYTPPVVITKFLLFEKPYFMDTIITSKNTVELSYHQNYLSFEFAALNFTFPEKNQYAYLMEGINKEWVYCGTRRQTQFTNLDPGNYTFRVKACNNDGVWNETGTSLNIVIKPPFWKTWWFYVSSALAFIGLTIAYIRFRTRAILKQYEVLEHKVQERTSELRDEKEKTEVKSKELEKTLGELRATQNQLIHSEKMASLGQLTAGIAHEIQNPLNFVNNFSLISQDLITEIESKPSPEESGTLMNDLKQNLEKISHHGKRAERIVKSMLMHSRTSAADKIPTDINKLVEDALNLAFTSLRAKDNSFTCESKLILEPTSPVIPIIQQDISRVILNLINNAFYAVNERRKNEGPGYKPLLIVTTSKSGNKINISVKDNGTGMPKEIRDKIFQPFFTTKPTGEGTGLGLSLSYDIVIKGHNGQINVDSRTGEGTEFIISLPIS